MITFPEGFYFYISSPIERFITELSTVLLCQNVKLEEQNIKISNLTNISMPLIADRHIIRTLSPIVTVITDRESKKTVFPTPESIEFRQLIKNNLIQKALLFNSDFIEREINIKPLKTKKVVINYKDFYITGYDGLFELNGDSELIKTAYLTGLGSKNSQGFGMVEVIM